MPDTFSRFQPRERGLFGDNEYERPRVNAGVKSTLLDLDLPYVRQTPLAVGVQPGNEVIWLPKSQIEFELTGEKQVRVTLPRWLAKEKGLI